MLVTGILLFGGAMACSMAGILDATRQTVLGHETAVANWTPLDLPPAAREGLKLTMREHLEAIKAIVGALGREDFSGAAALAHEDLGFPKHHVAMEREEGATFPPAYHELAMAHHQAAEELGEIIPTKNQQAILLQLEQTIHACVECHQTFRLQD